MLSEERNVNVRLSADSALMPSVAPLEMIPLAEQHEMSKKYSGEELQQKIEERANELFRQQSIPLYSFGVFPRLFNRATPSTAAPPPTEPSQEHGAQSTVPTASTGAIPKKRKTYETFSNALEKFKTFGKGKKAFFSDG